MIREYQEEIERLKKQLEGSLPPEMQVIERRIKSNKKDHMNSRLQKEK